MTRRQGEQNPHYSHYNGLTGESRGNGGGLWPNQSRTIRGGGSCICDHRVDQLRRHGAYGNVQTAIASAIALRLLERCPRADGRAAFKERIHGRRRRGVGVERAPRRLTCRGDCAAIWPAIVASSRRRSASSRAASLFASSAMRASHSASASGVMRLIRVPGISSSLGPRPRFFNL
jgi:hypothetical protein